VTVSTLDPKTALPVVDLQKGIFPKVAETGTTQQVLDLLATTSRA